MHILKEIWDGFAIIGMIATVITIAFGWQQWKKAVFSARHTNIRHQAEAEQVKASCTDIGFEAANPPPR